jgi:hypothetical protein
MNKAQKVVFGFFAIAAVVIAGLFIVYLNLTGKAVYIPGNETIFFYGDSCAHCKIVEEFMAENNITSKIPMTMKESFSNETNGKELIAAGNYCKLPKENIGRVPLLYAEGKCYLGDTDIIDYLKNKSGVK